MTWFILVMVPLVITFIFGAIQFKKEREQNLYKLSNWSIDRLNRLYDEKEGR